jgi:hypothetical protein
MQIIGWLHEHALRVLRRAAQRSPHLCGCAIAMLRGFVRQTEACIMRGGMLTANLRSHKFEVYIGIAKTRRPPELETDGLPRL